jgi:hypothetical protein
MNNVKTSLLKSLIKFDKPISMIETALRTLDWDSDVRLVTLRPADLMTILERYVKDELSENDVETWANLVEGREDIEVDDEAKEILFELANPELVRSISKPRALLLLQKLQT